MITLLELSLCQELLYVPCMYDINYFTALILPPTNLGFRC